MDTPESPFAAIWKRAIHILGVAFLLLALSPTAVPSHLVRTLEQMTTSSDVPLKMIENALLMAPDWSVLYLPAAQAALRENNLPSAISYLDLAQKHAVAPTTLKCTRAEIQIRSGQLAPALEAWQSSDSACPQSIDFLSRVTTAALDSQNYGLATAALEEHFKLRPGDAQILLQLGTLTAIQDPEAALSYLQLALDLMPESEGWIRDLIRNIEDARVFDEPAYSYAQVGIFLSNHNQWEYARVALEAAVQADPNYSDAYAYLGLALDRTGEDGGGEIQRAIDLAPNQTLPHLLMGIHWLDQNEPGLSINELILATELDPENPAIAAQLGAAHAADGNVEAAIEAYLFATDLEPQDPDFWLLLAQYSLAQRYDIENIGLPAARNAAGLAPENSRAFAVLGYSNFLAGDFTSAEEAFNHAIRLDSQNALTQYYLGQLRSEQGDFEAAVAAFQMAARLNPHGPLVDLSARALEAISP
jgi:tetratricopeptide (TPR) repeat protein